jgi:hypothetical protein
MLLRWQIVALAILVLAMVLAELVFFPNSYAHAYLWGQCKREPMPAACSPRFAEPAGGPGMAHAP